MVKTESSVDMTRYELMVMLSPGELDFEKTLEDIIEMVSSIGGEVDQKADWGVRELAYKIKKFDKAFYSVMSFTLPDSKRSRIKELEKDLTIAAAVIRFLLSKTGSDYVFKTISEYEDESEVSLADLKKKQSKIKPAPFTTIMEDAKVEKKAPKKEEVVADLEVKTEEKETIKEEVVEKKEPKKEEVVEKKAPEKEEVKVDKEKIKEAKTATEKSKKKLQEVDDKLKMIIDDPDISL